MKTIIVDRKKFPQSYYFLQNAESLAKNNNFLLMINLGNRALNESPDSKTCATIYCWIADASAASGNLKTGEYWAQNAYVLAAYENDSYNMVWSLLIQSRCHRNNPSEALSINRRAEKLYDLNCVNDHKLYANLLFNELMITTGSNWKYGPDSVLVERILDTCGNHNLTNLETWTLLRISEYIADDKPDRISTAKMYMSWIKVDQLPIDSLELKTYRLIDEKIRRTPTPPVPASNATFLSQYASWIAGAAVVAGLAVARSYCMKPKL